MAETTAPPSTAGPEERRTRRLPPTSIIVGLLVAVLVIGGAWYVGERQGWGQIGEGSTRTLLPKIGEVAPDLVALNGDGDVVTLSQFRGQPVWLNFWGSWCPPCRAEMPEMQQAYEQLAPRGLVLLAVSLDEPVEAAVSYADLNGATYLVAGDPYRKGSTAYPIFNFPTHILIDRDGIVRDIVLAELNAAEFITHAEVILGPDGEA